jgi:phosphatidate cytidylyltransferase
MSKGMKPPPPIIGAAISLLCVTLNAWAYLSGGKTASAMAVATFFVLSLQLLAVEKPRFSQLTSSVFGLLYCGTSGAAVLIARVKLHSVVHICDTDEGECVI